MVLRSILTCLGILSFILAFSQRQQERLNYIERYKDIAIKEMERAGIPASIKLAQAILESDAGRSVLARKANNHFGIKCGSAWEGKTYYREDDDYDEYGNLLKSCFRVYRNTESSFIAHSEFLMDPRKEYRYGFLFLLDPKDYRQWAYGLKRAGYATNPNYPQLLIGLIENYQLDKYDHGALIGPIDDDVPPLLAGSGIFLVNDAKVTLAEIGDTPDDIAYRTGVSARRILKFNEMLDSNNEQIAEGTRVYLQRKRSFFRGRQKWHNVQAGETMFSISQLYGIRLDKLYRKNRIQEGTQPAVGERVKLRWKVKKDEIPRLRSEAPSLLDPVTGDDELEMDESDPTDPSTDFPDVTTPQWNPPNTTTVPPIEDPYSGSVINPPPSESDPAGSTINIEPVVVSPAPTNPEPTVNTIPEVTDVTEDAPTDALFYKVLRGDTLYKISRQYGTTVDNLKKWNKLNSDLIRSGWMLRVK